MELKDKKQVYKKLNNSAIITQVVLMLISYGLAILMVSLGWVYSDLVTAIIITIIFALIVIFITYYCSVEISYKVKKVKLFNNSDYKRLLELSDKYIKLSIFPSNKEAKRLDYAIIILKVNCDEAKFLSIYDHIKTESFKNITLAFYHILILINKGLYAKAYNEYLSFKVNEKFNYLIEVQVKTLKGIFDQLSTGSPSDTLKTLQEYINSNYLNKVLDKIKGVKIPRLEDGRK